MKVIKGMVIAVLLSIAVVASATIITNFYGKQDADIILNGMTEGWLKYGYWDGEEYKYMSIDENTVIPLDINATEFNPGDEVTIFHSIKNLAPKEDSYMITFEIDDSWFDNSNHPYYGFTYGVSLPIFYINYGEELNFSYWYKVNPTMVTPPEGKVHVKLWINATKEYQSNNPYPPFNVVGTYLIDNNSFRINWDRLSAEYDAIVVKNASGIADYPHNIGDGTIIFSGKSSVCFDTNLLNYRYYYSLWTYDESTHLYSSTYATVSNQTG